MHGLPAITTKARPGALGMELGSTSTGFRMERARLDSLQIASLTKYFNFDVA
jgi:hypothetical protein